MPQRSVIDREWNAYDDDDDDDDDEPDTYARVDDETDPWTRRRARRGQGTHADSRFFFVCACASRMDMEIENACVH